MTLDQIDTILSQSQRWGTNRQPDQHIVLEFLTKHEWPVSSIDVDDDTLVIQVTRPLTVEQAVELGKNLRPDEFDDYGDNSYRLWWD